MSTLLVIAYPEKQTAYQVLQDLRAKQEQFVVNLSDAVIVYKDDKGKVKLDQSVNLQSTGAVSGAFWGMLIGLIFFMPWLGLLVGAFGGWLGGKFSDYGIPDKFIKEVGSNLEPGGSELFLLIESYTQDKFLAALAPYGGHVIQASISEEQTQKLQEYLDTHGQQIQETVAQATVAAETTDAPPAAPAADAPAADAPAADAPKA
jgi:uncharacterized membrane protein